MNGPDACRKLCILAAMAFGRRVMPEQVPTEGITGVTLADVAYAASCGKKVKFLGRAVRLPDDAVCAYVAPHLVDEENPLAVVEDVFNGITVKGDAVGDLMFYGHGAGRLATASAVVGDIIDVVKHRQRGERRRGAWGRRGYGAPPGRPGERLVRAAERGPSGRGAGLRGHSVSQPSRRAGRRVRVPERPHAPQRAGAESEGTGCVLCVPRSISRPADIPS